jgi:ADP-heptose:LPS heptosyltransferase
VELRGDFRDIVFALLSGASAVIGCGWRGGHTLLDYDVPFDTQVHQVAFALAIASGAGADPSPRPPFLAIEERERARAAALLQGLDATLIGIHLGAGFPSKCLPLDKFVAVANAICDRWASPYGPRPAFVVVGGNDERDIAEQFRRLVSGRSINLAGRLSLKGTAAVLAQCRLFIGNDSGPMHLAAAMGTPVVTFFGPSEPFRFHPYGVPYKLLEVDLPCRPCDFVHCAQGDHRCLSSLKEERIIQAAEQLLAEHL